MIKGQTLKRIKGEIETAETEAYACQDGNCAHAEHKAVRYARFRRVHPNGLKPPKVRQ